MIAGAFAVQAITRAQTAADEPKRQTPSALAEMSRQLRWNDAESHAQYDLIKDKVTDRLLTTVDGFVASGRLIGANGAAVKEAIDMLLVDFKSPALGNVAFWTELPSGRYLLLGLDVSRLSGATLDDAIAFRAYRESNGRLLYASQAARDLDGWVLEKLFALPSITGEQDRRFMVLVRAPSIGTPYLLKARLYTFDGSAFRALWTSDDFRTDYIESAVRKTATGFAVQRYDKQNPAAWRFVEDEYIQTPDGAERSESVEVSPPNK
jgi:hypothetical protein